MISDSSVFVVSNVGPKITRKCAKCLEREQSAAFVKREPERKETARCNKCKVALTLPNGTEIRLGVGRDDIAGPLCASCWHNYYASGNAFGASRPGALTDLEVKEQYIAQLHTEADADEVQRKADRKRLKELEAENEKRKVAMLIACKELRVTERDIARYSGEQHGMKMIPAGVLDDAQKSIKDAVYALGDAP